MATAEPRRRWLRLGGPVVLLLVGVAVVTTIVLRDRAQAPEPEPEPDPVSVSAESVYDFTTVEEMVDASDLVVRARVIATDRGALLGADGSDPADAGVVVREVTIQVDEVWAPSGAAPVQVGDRLVVAEEGWLASGEPLIVDGLAPSRVGDDAVWFLQALPDAPNHLVINSQGRYLVDGDRLTGAEGDDPLVAAVVEGSPDALRDDVRTAAGH